MLIIYRLLTIFFYPLLILIIFIRKFFNKEDFIRYKEKIFPEKSLLNKNVQKKLIWFHSASIGETQSIIPLIKRFIKYDQEIDILITTITLSSGKLISQKFKNNKNIKHRYLPLDLNFLANRFLYNWEPDIALFVDSEIWPNLLQEIKKRNIPLILLNGRITNRTFSKWSLIPSTAKKIFNLFDLCLIANKETKKYLLEFNARNIKDIGNIKFATRYEFDKKISDNKNFSTKKNIWCAVSTHKGEEEFIIKTHLKLKVVHDSITTIIIPRHIKRIKNIESICRKYNVKFQILSEKEKIRIGNEIIIVNSYGRVSEYLKLCDSVFIGKSLLKKLKSDGGQNPIEAAKLGCKIYHGPYVYNFEEIYKLLSKYKIAEQITSEINLFQKLKTDFDKKIKIKNENAIKNINQLGEKILENTFQQLKGYIKK